ncbi:DNA gyrase subunit A [Patescibacteria group bacterium]|nr:DNA gyrase subunit A [Patescibacteria group bacterium]
MSGETQVAVEYEGPSINSITEDKFGKIKHISIISEMEKSYLDYAMSVIVSRALPDVRDGLKPVHRRILYSMYKSGIHHTSAYKKCARIVGDVLGRYHPHGDSSVYSALVRLAQDFSMRYPLVDGQGNFGSVDGDSPAAMRYTEARLAKISKELLGDIDKKTVQFENNFDGSLQEPTVLPTRLPNLLLMGSEGIAVGMATKIPPHNLTEVSEAILAMLTAGESVAVTAPVSLDEKETKKIDPQSIKDHNAKIDALLASDARSLAGAFSSQISIDEIMEYIQGPDFPTGGIMYDFQAIKEAYHTGKGKVVVRAKTEIVEDKKGNFKILVTEIPYQVNKARLIMKIADLVRNKKIDGIKDLNDDSDRTGMQITIELKRDARPKVVLNSLFKYTELQSSFPMNVVALNSEGTPQLMNIKHVLGEYISHRQLVVVRRAQFELSEARARAHVLEGLLIALGHLDEVIATIRKSADTDTARASLMKKFGLSEIQATAILEMQLKRLAALERQKIEDEYKALKELMDKLITLLISPKNILDVIATETKEMIEQYGDKRRTKLVKGKIGEFSEQDLIANEATVITLTQTGYIKRYSPSALRSQHRGGKGAIGIKTKDEDAVHSILTANTHDSLLLFTNQGRVFRLKAFEIPESGRQAKGTALVNLVNLRGNGETVRSILILDEVGDKDCYITLATRQGLVKKTAVKLYQNIRQNGIIAILLKDNDELVWGKVTNGKDELMLISHQGKSIRFSETEVKSSNRDTQGVKGIELKKDDFVVGVEALSQDAETRQLLLVTENGLGKRTDLSQYPVQKRAGQGVKVAEITKKTGNVVSAMMVTELNKEIVLTTESGQMIKMPLTDECIPVLTRPTQGVILMRPKAGDKVVAVAVTNEVTDVEGEAEAPAKAE